MGETLDRWLKHKANGRKARPRTITNYRWMFDAYVKPELGDKPIAELSEIDVQELYTKLLEGPQVGEEGPKIGPKTLRNLHKALEPALKRARKLETAVGESGCARRVAAVGSRGSSLPHARSSSRFSRDCPIR